MATIRVVAHLNELTKEVGNDYYLTAQVTNTLDVEGAVVYAFEQPGATGPVTQNITDPTEGVANQLNHGGMALIQGMHLSLKGEAPVSVCKESERPDEI